MRRLKNPEKRQWPELVRRPTAMENDRINIAVNEVLAAVKSGGDEAVRRYTAQFDKVTTTTLAVGTAGAADEISAKLQGAIRTAFKNIETFHRAQLLKPEKIETQPGVTCWREARPIDPVGLYVPGGSAPLFSSLLMLGIPARLAGCRNIVVCTPPSSNGAVSAVIRYTASLLGIDKIYAVGGAQAIAAMAYGTETIPQVHKIFGPGNSYVTTAKRLVQNDGVGIDMPAGPSEVLIIADQSANPAFVASDLLSQAEHGTDSQVVLASDSSILIERTLAQIDKQILRLPRRKIASSALQHSLAIEFDTIGEAMEFSNAYAPEHLILNCRRPEIASASVESAGSVFIGPWSCESMGDYASGTNHTLPTAGFARNYSGVSVDSFIKKITFQEISKNGLIDLGPTVQIMAMAEGLTAHEKAVSIRLKTLTDD